MSTKNPHALDLRSILNAIDRRNLSYYKDLTSEEKKHYVPLNIMRFMSSLNSQNPNAFYAVIAVNDLVNIGFWSLSKHPELQHLLLCLTGIGGGQNRPWMAISRKKKSGKISAWLSEQHPHLNDEEIEIIKSQYDTKSWKEHLRSSGISDKEVNELVEAWKKERA